MQGRLKYSPVRRSVARLGEGRGEGRASLWSRIATNSCGSFTLKAFHSSTAGFWITVALVAALVGYPLSFGPACC